MWHALFVDVISAVFMNSSAYPLACGGASHCFLSINMPLLS